MELTWTATHNFSTSYNVQHGPDEFSSQALNNLTKKNRFKTLRDPLLTNEKAKENDPFQTMSQISFSHPNTKPKTFSLLDTNSSGYTKNNLNNDGKTFYNGRESVLKDMKLTEYKNRFRPFK